MQVRSQPSMERLSAGDARELCGLTEHVGWGHTLDDWRDFLAVGEFFGHRSPDGRIVSSTGLFRYGPELDSVGIVIVHESERGRGLARELMQRVMSDSRAAVLTLIATEMGVPLYDKLGFAQVSSVIRCMGRPSAAAAPGHVRALDPRDHARVLELDAAACGTDRSAALTRLLSRALVARVLIANDRSIAGFGLALPKGAYVHLGPIVAPDEQGALALAAALAAHCAGTTDSVRIDVPREQRAFARRLEQLGLGAMREDPVMTRGGLALPGDRTRLYGISFQAFG